MNRRVKEMFSLRTNLDFCMAPSLSLFGPPMILLHIYLLGPRHLMEWDYIYSGYFCILFQANYIYFERNIF